VTTTDTNAGATTAATIAARLDSPPASHSHGPGWAQSLAKGAAGIALLHIDRAHAGTGSWQTAHTWIAAATSEDLTAGPQAGLYFGVPAVAYAVHSANTGRPGPYEQPLATLDASVADMTRRRLDQAHERIDKAVLSTFSEWDLIYGLTGIGAYLMRRDPHDTLLSEILSYLVRLTQPLRIDGETLPGWWTPTAPTGKTAPQFPGGHGNLGMAHGITGPLALLCLVPRYGVTVDGHTEAVARILAWLDRWRQDADTGSWWPQWVTSSEQRTGRFHRPGPPRPSWCYGTPGLARAQQLAGIATGDTARQRLAETALRDCLADPTRLGQLTDPSLCHGWAGLYQTAWRTVQEASTVDLLTGLRLLKDQLTRQATRWEAVPDGLLEGDAGLGLVLHTINTGTIPTSDWDTCLLITAPERPPR
jgi:hypothetical protein